MYDKAIWDSTPVVMSEGTECGKKIFNTTNAVQRKHCANELVIRRYLAGKKFENIAKLGKIEPESLSNYINSLNIDDIKENFDKICRDTEKELESIAEVKIYIELGFNNVSDYFQTIAVDYDNHENEVNESIKGMYQLLVELQKNGVVNADIKPQNLLYTVRNGSLRLILNDFDTSFVLPSGVQSKPIAEPSFTHSFPTPEFVGMFGNKIGYKTDVALVGQISYMLLNEYRRPTEYENVFDSISSDEINTLKKKLYKKIEKGKIRLKPSPNGTESLKNAVLASINVNPDDRPTASEVLKSLNSEKSGTPSNIITINNVTKPENSTNKTVLATALATAAALICIFALIKYLPLNRAADNEQIISDNNSSSAEIQQNTASALLTSNVTITVTSAVRTESLPAVTEKAEDNKSNGVNFNGNVQSASVSIDNSSNNYNTKHETNNTYNSKNEINNNNTIINQEAPQQPETTAPVIDLQPVIEFTYEWVELPELNDPYTEETIHRQAGGYEITGYTLSGDFTGITDYTLEIPSSINGERVVSVSNDAFNGLNVISSLIIPNSVYEIGDRAFKNCPNLGYIELGNSISKIGYESFYNSVWRGMGQPRISVNCNLGNISYYIGEDWCGPYGLYIPSELYS